MSSLVEKKDTVQDGNFILSEVFAKVFRAYLECSDSVQIAIREMVDVVNDPNATSQEVHSAKLTIAEGLFPTHHHGSLGADLQELEESAPADVQKLLDNLNKQEATFSDRVNALLKSKGMTQSDLATAAGVGQSAISMMLSRKCRPQHSTVTKIAEALEIPPSGLWPNYDD